MAGGKKYKFQGSVFQFGTSFDETSPGPVSVTAITKADPPVVTATAHGLGTAGTVTAGKFDSVEGMVELDDETVIVQVVDANSFNVLNRDGTNYTTFSGTALFYPVVMSTWCEVTGWNRQGGSSPEIDATDACSDYAEFLIGLPDFGTVQADFHYAPETTIQQAMEEFQASGEKTVMSYALPDSRGTRWILGFIQQTGEQSAVAGKWTGSMTFRSTGKPVTVLPS